MDRSLSLAAGWNNLGALLVTDGYTGRYLVRVLTVTNKTAGPEVVTVRRHTSSTTAPVSDSGQHLDPGDSYTIPNADPFSPMDMKMVWLLNSGAGAIAVDVSGSPQ